MSDLLAEAQEFLDGFCNINPPWIDRDDIEFVVRSRQDGKPVEVMCYLPYELKKLLEHGNHITNEILGMKSADIDCNRCKWKCN